MATIGIEALICGVEDFDTSIRFFEDFGLPLAKQLGADKFAHFRLAEGASVYVRSLDDLWFLKSSQVGKGARECIWGLDTQESLDELIEDMAGDHDLKRELGGTVRFVTAFGQALGLKMWRKKPIFNAFFPVNSLGNIQRVNEMRKWIKRAIPKTVNHIVWGFPDVNEALDFDRDRSKFRLSEIQLDSGVYIRADGAGDHHNGLLADASNRTLGFNGVIEFHHANFGVEDIDVLDDRWVPRIWEQLFGFHLCQHDMPDFLTPQEIEWNVGFCDPMDYYPVEGTSAAPSAQRAIRS